MQSVEQAASRRVLVVDDNRAIHEDFHKILSKDTAGTELADLEIALFGEPTATALPVNYQVDDAYQGQEAHQMLSAAHREGWRYDLAFVDMRMPPGWDGVQTIEHLWDEDPELQIVICTAYSDYTWSDLFAKFGRTDNLLILKKPFDNAEVQQLAATLTEKRRLKQEATLRMENLEEMVEQRTAELREKEKQLRQKQKLEAIGALASGIAHEFNNLLQTIQGYTRFAVDELDPESRIQQDLQEALSAADRAAHLTRQMLTFGRKESLRKILVSPNAAVKDLICMLRPIIGANIDIKVDLGDNPAPVLADSIMPQQVLMNICVNARDAMPTGGLLTICTENVFVDDSNAECHPDLHRGRYARISVTDTGCGMAPEVRERAFEPFFTTKEVGEGTGLGLATVYGVVQQHDGMIDVESEPGRGTTFRIYLPAAEHVDLEQELAGAEISGAVSVERLAAVSESCALQATTRVT